MVGAEKMQELNLGELNELVKRKPSPELFLASNKMHRPSLMMGEV